MNSTLRKVLNIIVDVLVVLVLIVSLLVVVLSLTTKSSGVPNIFGVAPLSVQSDSMKGTFDTGDVLLCEVTNDPNAIYQVGDVVSFPIEIDGIQTYNTHRIVEVIDRNGIYYYVTQGDNREMCPDPDFDEQTSATIVAKWTGNKIPWIGHVLSFIRTQNGFFFCVLLPMILFFAYEVVRVVMHIIAYNKEKALAEAQQAVQNAELTEEQKQKAIEEYLASIGQTPNAGDEACVQTPAQDNTTDSE